MGVGGLGDIAKVGGTNQAPATSTSGHALTVAELPSHAHVETLSGGVGPDPGYVHTPGQLWGSNNIAGGKKTEPTGDNAEHSHSIAARDNRPAYFSVVFIMKL